MRIAINGLFLGQQTTGSGQYTAQLLRALQALAPAHDYIIEKPVVFKTTGFLPDAITKTVVPPVPGATRRGFKTMVFSTVFKKPASPDLPASRYPFIRLASVDSHLSKLLFEQFTFPRACRTARVDIAHVPYWASPLFPTVPTVVTVHDLIPLLLPLYRGSLLVRLYTRLVAASARRAACIITDSQASRADIVRHLRVPPERVHVIYLAADDLCRPVTEPAALSAVRARYGLPERYILYLGGFDARKNLRALFAAYARLRDQLGSAAPTLVVAGRLPDVDRPLFPAPERLARELGIRDAVLFTGWIPDEDKAPLYSGALFFAFLSLYEGFGLMPLEAMACGTPVLAARLSSLPEVVGDGGLLVDPSDLDAVVAAMSTLVRDNALRADLRDRALAHSARFTWSQTASQTLSVYEKIHHQATRTPRE